MRIIALCLICSISFTSTSIAQQVRVLKVVTKVYYHGSRKLIEEGKTLSPGVQMDFATPEDVIYLVVPNVGIRWIDGAHARQIPGAKAGELIATLKDLLPHTRKEQLVGRGDIFNTPEEIGQYFRMLNPGPMGLLVIDDRKLPVSRQMWEQRQQHFFLLKYSYRGKEISRRLSFIEEKRPDSGYFLVIDTNVLRTNGRPPVIAQPVNCRLFFYNAVLKAAQPLAPLPLNIRRLSALSPELCLIRSSGSPDWQDEAVDFLQTVYGSTTKHYFLEKMVGLICR